MMQITDLAQEEKILPLFRLGFRPFFLLGATFAVISITIWLMFHNGVLTIYPFGGGYWWHIHEMIFGFASAIIAGFLLTAVQTWTGIRSVHGKGLLFIVTIWALGRLSLLLANTIPAWLITIIDLSFFPITAYLLAKPLLAVKQSRNFFFIPILLVFFLLNSLMHYTVYQASTLSVQQLGYASVTLIALLISIIAGRVTPMFTANGTNTKKVKNIKVIEFAAHISLFSTFVCFLLGNYLKFDNQYIGYLLILSGILQAIRALRWKPWITLSVPLLWSIHGALLCLWSSLLLLGIGYLVNVNWLNHAWHLLTVGSISAMILAMIARVSLGHTGRSLQLSFAMNIAFISIFIAAVIRSLLPILLPQYTPLTYALATFFFSLSFCLFLIIYTPYLLSPRVDKRPG